MPNLEPKLAIQNALQDFVRKPLAQAALALLETLGYRSDKRLAFMPNSAAQFRLEFDQHNQLNIQIARLNEWKSVDFLFQITGDELAGALSSQGQLFRNQKVDQSLIHSYLFFAIELSAAHYTRTDLAAITREVNKLFPMPAMLVFKHADTLTLAIITRRINKRDGNRDVLEKVTLIKDIRLANPHRAHLEILLDLSLAQLAHAATLTNFVELQRAWEKTLDTSELNKRFYRDVANWYFWAVRSVKFPGGVADEEIRNATAIIRLITRLIFVWFIKEKGLVPEGLFDQRQLKELLNYSDPQKSTYYKAILQNLFFATLNTEMGEGRRFRGKNKNPNGLDAHHGISTVFRYEDYFKNPQVALRLFAGIPFLNGGLFECLDKRDEKVLVDGFSDNPRSQPVVPDELFFGAEHAEDLSAVYGDARRSHEPVRGLIHIFNNYKFTIEENTPIEEEIALDPELLGKVFENLLAAYNPETGTTARKQTGSFYTPREIVDYMVDEALIAYLEGKLPDAQDAQVRLRHLLAYNNDAHQFSDDEEYLLISAIDSIKVLDPAAGSGAFPMGVLHKLVFILNKLDPGNVHWQERQIAKASEIPDPAVREKVIADIEQSFAENELDYGRKLYLIENCIYGVDIQPIAVQIAKLRFFISLVVEQKTDPIKPNHGIRPLPNLETKFVAANTLIGIEKPQQMMLRNPLIDQKEKELAEARRKHFSARTPATKRKYREQDKQLREELAGLLKKDGWGSAAAEQLAGWDPYDQNSSASFFDPEWMFGTIGGFDTVIGNPPYISHDKIENKEYLRKYSCYEPFADIYCYFIEIGTRFQKQSGILSFITSNSYLRAEYGSPIRKLLRKENEILNLINLDDAQIFESAIVNVAILITRKNSNGNRCFVFNSPFSDSGDFALQLQRQGFYYDQRIFDSKSWSLIRPEKVIVQQKIETAGFSLEKLGTKIRLGLATGNNDAFIINALKREFFLNKNRTNGNIIKPILRGRDINRYYYHSPDQFILLTKNGVNVERDFPDIFKYLSEFGESFKTRGAQGQHWTNLRACAFFEDFREEKIIWIELTDRGRFTLCTEEIYLLNSAYFLLPPKGISSKYLLGILNSQLIQFYLEIIAETSGMGTSRWINNYVKEFPIPVISYSEQQPIIEIVDRILSAKQNDDSVETTNLEQNINFLVYALYGLSEDEIKIVEGGIGKSTALSDVGKKTVDDELISLAPEVEILKSSPNKDVSMSATAQTESLPSDYGMYKCSECGKIAMGFAKESHKHPGKVVEWKKVGR